jgi:hypothetical protein
MAPSLNSEASNKSFDEKKEVYKKANIKLLNAIVSEYDVWDSDKIKSRTEGLIKFAKEQWKDLIEI